MDIPVTGVTAAFATGRVVVATKLAGTTPPLKTTGAIGLSDIALITVSLPVPTGAAVAFDVGMADEALVFALGTGPIEAIGAFTNPDVQLVPEPPVTVTALASAVIDLVLELAPDSTALEVAGTVVPVVVVVAETVETRLEISAISAVRLTVSKSGAPESLASVALELSAVSVVAALVPAVDCAVVVVVVVAECCRFEICTAACTIIADNPVPETRAGELFFVEVLVEASAVALETGRGATAIGFTIETGSLETKAAVVSKGTGLMPTSVAIPAGIGTFAELAVVAAGVAAPFAFGLALLAARAEKPS